MLMLLSWSVAVAADCPDTTTNAEVSSDLQAALLSYAVMDAEAFAASADLALQKVECLGEKATPQLAASLHRVRGVRAVFEGDVDAGVLSFAAARSIEPDHTLAATLAPTGGKLANAYGAAGTRAPLGRVDLDVQTGAYDVWVDGVMSDTRPDGPYIIQVVENDTPWFSAFVTSGAPSIPEALLGEEEAASPTPAPVPMPAPEAPAAPAPAAPPAVAAAPKKGKGLLWAGLASGGVAAGLYGTAVAGRVSYDSNPSTGAASLTNGAYFGSVGTAAVSAGLLTAFLATR